MIDTSRLIHQLLDKNNWEVVSEIDTFLYVYDRMPRQMRVIVDLKMTGNTIEEIACILGAHIETVRKQLNRAKARIIKSFKYPDVPGGF